ncbi:MAG: Do family serine endopeptidase [Sphingobacteriia bacterium]|nr:Do family serine endopeptidase [Sphingobacteriia bacterium]
MNFKNVLGVVAISATTAVASVWGFSKFAQSKYAGTQEPGKLPVNYAGFFGNNTPASTVDFTQAATSATPAVVHIKTRTKAKQVTNNLPKRKNPFSDLFGDDMFDDFFGSPRSMTIPEQRASGSGVIISEDGYIVTNNHVIEGADEINITLPNKKSYKASIIGSDPSSDIAVIKIDAKGLPYLIYGNSDETKLGQWVLAIGYPLNLDVTVTAGIVSAKSRSININDRQSKTPVESFIQTDAAVNPGNSGGALINTGGELIGINSAIASPTGSYAGYSYAIPVNIVKKVVNDIIKYGTVQRAFIGISYAPEGLSDEQKKEQGIKDVEGVYVLDVPAGGAASAAGLKKGDIVTKVNGSVVKSGPEMVEQVARYKPGDKITLTYLRDGKENTVPIILKNKVGNTDIVKETNIIDKLGADFENVDKKTAAANDIAGGVVVKKIKANPMKSSRIQEGFVITSVNGVAIKSLDDLKDVLKGASGTIYFEGIYPGYEGTYRHPVNLGDE